MADEGAIMKIDLHDWAASPAIDITDFVAREMDDLDVGGVLEEALHTARNTAKAFGRLVELLAEKNTLTPTEVSFIATGYHNHHATFED